MSRLNAAPERNRGAFTAAVVLIALGAVLIVVGVALFVLPGPGLIPFVIGLALVAGGLTLRATNN